MSFDKYSKGQKLTWALLIGGVSFGDQEMKLDRGVDVLIATPGRLLDHFERGKLLLTGVQIMVVDEADRMLDMGFIPDLERIFKLTPAKKQTLFFSATMPPEITRLTKQFLTDPARIEADRPATAAENIFQRVVRVPSADHGVKRLGLRALVGREEVKNGIVFCNRKSEVDIVAKSLRKHGFDASPIHGDLDQSMRTRTLEAFRAGDLKILVASDVAARGLDIPDVSHIFNYDVPHHADDYVHRIGRTGRAGKSGVAYTLVSPADGRALDKVIRLIGQAPEEVTLDVDWSEARTESRSRAPRGESARSGARSGERGRKDGRGRGRPASETSVASMEPLTPNPAATDPSPPPVDTPSPAPAAAVEAVASPRPHKAQRNESRGDQPRRDEAQPQESRRETRPARGQARSRPERPRRDARPAIGGNDREPRSRDEDSHVIGFGGDLPAFLARPMPAPALAED